MKRAGRKLAPTVAGVLALALTLTAGCSETRGKGKRGANGNTAGGDDAYAISWVSSQTAPVEPDAEMIRYWNEKFNVKLDVWNMAQKNAGALLERKLASGEIPDKLYVTNFSDLQQYARQDVLAAIPPDLLKRHAPGLYANINKEMPGAFNYAAVDGRIFGIPSLNANSRFREPVVWRGDWLEALGIAKTPETLDEFEAALYRIAHEDPDGNGQKDTYGMSLSAMTMIYGAFGYHPGSWNEKDGRLVYGGVQPEMKQALGLLGKWYRDGVIDPQFITGENSGAVLAISHAFVNGRIGLTSHGGYYYYWKPLLFEGDATSDNYLELKKADPGAADSLRYGLPPKGPGGRMGAKQNTLLAGGFVAFGKQLERDPDKFAKILQMVEFFNASSYENSLLTVYGPQGKYWDFDAYGQPNVKYNMKKADFEKIGASLIFYNLEMPEFIVQRDNRRMTWASENGFEIGGLTNKLLTVLPSQQKYIGELNAMQERTYVSIITGDKPIDAFDEFVRAWKTGGGEQLEKEANEWWLEMKK
ncbi:MAG: extracellular solute-binding protein [Paenibacillus sp.]|nr:extracellular solute-binding protein [Paenibacillus sp.]